jgi:hypothetical protein
MNDRELLESAARAAGYGELRFLDDSSIIVNARRWNPLTDDGDAMRLAVKLHMGVQSNGSNHWESPDCTIVLFDGPVCGHRLVQRHDDNPEAATRRAIVRAAAAMAKTTA